MLFWASARRARHSARSFSSASICSWGRHQRARTMEFGAPPGPPLAPQVGRCGSALLWLQLRRQGLRGGLWSRNSLLVPRSNFPAKRNSNTNVSLHVNERTFRVEKPLASLLMHTRLRIAPPCFPSVDGTEDSKDAQPRAQRGRKRLWRLVSTKELPFVEDPREKSLSDLGIEGSNTESRFKRTLFEVARPHRCHGYPT